MNNESFTASYIDLVRYTRTNDITRKARALDSIDAILLG